MSKKKNGFTLIELLVTIAIMISILGIAIVAFINISNRKKEEAYQNVKGQIELAAEQFFDTNRYLFEGLTENGTKGEISLGKLVNDGYLTKVTDPRTGKALSYCTIIEVKKENGAYVTSLKEGSGASNDPKDCASDNTIEIVEAGGPKIEVKASGNKLIGTSIWFTSNAKMNVKAETNKNGAISEIRKCTSNTGGCVPTGNNNESVVFSMNNGKVNLSESLLEEMNRRTYCYQAKNVAGKIARACDTASVDLNPPTCTNTVVGSKNNSTVDNWYNIATGAPVITFNGTDSMSKIKGNSTIKPAISQGSKTYKHTFEDNAGHKKECSVTVKYDNVAPTCKMATTTGPDGSNGWYRKERVDLKITNMSNDVKSWGWKTNQWDSGEKYTFKNCPSGNCNVSDLYITAEGKRTASVYMKDQAGNSGSCSAGEIKIDRTPPTCASNNGTTSWTNQNRTITQNCQDSVSGCSANSVSKSFTTSTKTSSLQIKDNAGNTRTCNINVYVDKNKPSCSVAISGTKGNKVGNVQWYIKNNVTIKLNQSKVSGWSPISTYGLATSKKSTNKATSATGGNNLKTTYYGYVKDAAGNEAECNSGPFGVETGVTLAFDAGSTGNAKSNRNGKPVFDTNKSGVCKFGNCGNIMCRTDSGLSTSCPKAYFARACRNVGGYTRYFKVTGASVGTNVSVNDNGAVKQTDTVNRYNCSKTGKYYFKGCDKSGGQIDVSGHEYQYTSPAGSTSNKIRLYVEYRADCGY